MRACVWGRGGGRAAKLLKHQPLNHICAKGANIYNKSCNDKRCCAGRSRGVWQRLWCLGPHKLPVMENQQPAPGLGDCLHRTDLSTRESALLCNGLGPVRRLAYSADGTSIWTASEKMGLASWLSAPLPVTLPALKRSRAASLMSPFRQVAAGEPTTTKMPPFLVVLHWSNLYFYKGRILSRRDQRFGKNDSEQAQW